MLGNSPYLQFIWEVHGIEEVTQFNTYEEMITETRTDFNIELRKINYDYLILTNWELSIVYGEYLCLYILNIIYMYK